MFFPPLNDRQCGRTVRVDLGNGGRPVGGAINGALAVGCGLCFCCSANQVGCHCSAREDLVALPSAAKDQPYGQIGYINLIFA
jgi:hypothetical protein